VILLQHSCKDKLRFFSATRWRSGERANRENCPGQKHACKKFCKINNKKRPVLTDLGGQQSGGLALRQQSNSPGAECRFTSQALIFFSLTALFAVLSGFTQPPQADEGTTAHIFQLSIVALLPTVLRFLTTADWTQPAFSMRRLPFPFAALVLAFGALYFLEHCR
jgi:hypothetical protein